MAVAQRFLAQNPTMPADQVGDIVQFIASVSSQQPGPQQQQPQQQATEPDAGLMTELMSMGFGEVAVRSALVMARNDKERAIELLLGSS